jgi:hypothetical protein
MNIGFTGTRNGMSENQKKTFEFIISTIPILRFHHGDCVGADEDAHNIVLEYRKTYQVEIIVHPPENRDYCKVNRDEYDEIKKPLSYSERNKNIVDSSDILIACPNTLYETTRSGTWSTVRYARKKKVPVIILEP